MSQLTLPFATANTKVPHLLNDPFPETVEEFQKLLVVCRQAQEHLEQGAKLLMREGIGSSANFGGVNMVLPRPLEEDRLDLTKYDVYWKGPTSDYRSHFRHLIEVILHHRITNFADTPAGNRAAPTSGPAHRVLTAWGYLPHGDAENGFQDYTWKGREAAYRMGPPPVRLDSMGTAWINQSDRATSATMLDDGMRTFARGQCSARVANDGKLTFIHESDADLPFDKWFGHVAPGLAMHWDMEWVDHQWPTSDEVRTAIHTRTNTSGEKVKRTSPKELQARREALFADPALIMAGLEGRKGLAFVCVTCGKVMNKAKGDAIHGHRMINPTKASGKETEHLLLLQEAGGFHRD